MDLWLVRLDPIEPMTSRGSRSCCSRGTASPGSTCVGRAVDEEADAGGEPHVALYVENSEGFEVVVEE